MPTNKRERQRENRAKKLSEQKKIEQQKKLRKRATQITVLVVVMGAALVLPTLLSNSDDATTTTTSTTTTTTAPPTTIDPTALPFDYESYRNQPTACGAETPPPVTEMTFTAAEDQGIVPEATVTATIATSCGDIVAELDPSIAPETVNSFVFLARQGYFDGSAFHRISPGSVIQGGDPTAIGTGNPGYLVTDEFPEVGFIYGRGVLAMANAGANSTGSQFFVVTGEDAGLSNTFSAFGTVVDSDDTLDRISAVQLTGRDGTANTEQSLPLETVYIESVEVEVSG